VWRRRRGGRVGDSGNLVYVQMAELSLNGLHRLLVAALDADGRDHRRDDRLPAEALGDGRRRAPSAPGAELTILASLARARATSLAA
jgi:hypothetical protein